MEWSEIAAWLFKGGGACVALYVANTLRELSLSVQALNVNIAVVIEKVANHEKRIERLEDR